MQRSVILPTDAEDSYFVALSVRLPKNPTRKSADNVPFLDIYHLSIAPSVSTPHFGTTNKRSYALPLEWKRMRNLSSQVEKL